MSMRGAGTHLISMAQVRVDGEIPHPSMTIAKGATWRWHGAPVRLDGPGAILFLGDSLDAERLRARAGRMVRKLMRGQRAQAAPDRARDPEDMVRDGGFIVSDGARFYPVVPIMGQETGLYLFAGVIPPANLDLTVIDAAPPRRPQRDAGAMICFTPGTLITTPKGPVPVEDLVPGDRVSTKDSGPQPIRWTGARHVSGARMHLDMSLRPIRIRAGALGGNEPRPDLVVSPDHRVVLRGKKAQALFGTPEVLVRACDLVDDRRVLVDHAFTQATYVHVLLDRHEVIWANGVETESFHPEGAALDHLTLAEAEMLRDAAGDPVGYGPKARRCLSTAEHAILRYESPPHYLA